MIHLSPERVRMVPHRDVGHVTRTPTLPPPPPALARHAEPQVRDPDDQRTTIRRVYKHQPRFPLDRQGDLEDWTYDFYPDGWGLSERSKTAQAFVAFLARNSMSGCKPTWLANHTGYYKEINDTVLRHASDRDRRRFFDAIAPYREGPETRNVVVPARICTNCRGNVLTQNRQPAHAFTCTSCDQGYFNTSSVFACRADDGCVSKCNVRICFDCFALMGEEGDSLRHEVITSRQDQLGGF